MNVQQEEVKRCIDVPLELGESPLWDAERGVLWFVDITAPAIFQYSPVDGTLKRHDMPSVVGCIGLAADQRLVAALKNGVHLFDPATGELQFLVDPESDRPDNRPNDGKVGPDGCFWLGTMEQNSLVNSGALYRITPQGECTRVLDDLFVSNGLAWSPDGKTMYHTDGSSPSIQAYDFDPELGTISNRRLLVTLDHEEVGWPDGATMDREGNYWCAGIYIGKINQISPQGEILRSIQMPAVATTMPCLGGASGRTLFVTSLGVDVDERWQDGTLLSYEVDAEAGPVYKFG